MKLFYKEIYIGDITITGHDFPWMHGTFAKHLEYEQFKDFFAFLVSNDKKEGDEKNFDIEMFDGNNWTIQNETETVWIFPPHIYDTSNEIGFRYYKFENLDYNEARAKALLEKFGFDFKPEYRNEIIQLLEDEFSDYIEGSSEYLRVLCGYLFCIGNPTDLELIKKIKYGINMDVGTMIDSDWICSMEGIVDEYTIEREELITNFINYYKNYFTIS